MYIHNTICSFKDVFASSRKINCTVGMYKNTDDVADPNTYHGGWMAQVLS